MSDEKKTCPRCKGEGTYEIKLLENGRRYPCHACKQVGYFLPPVLDDILKAIRGKRGLRTKRPDDDRAYYVWRLARFHGGVDVTMPMTAMSLLSNDPFLADLDRYARAVAKHVYGTVDAGRSRWAALLLNDFKPEPGLPATAYEGGPVVTEKKPAIERLELH